MFCEELLTTASLLILVAPMMCQAAASSSERVQQLEQELAEVHSKLERAKTAIQEGKGKNQKLMEAAKQLKEQLQDQQTVS